MQMRAEERPGEETQGEGGRHTPQREVSGETSLPTPRWGTSSLQNVGKTVLAVSVSSVWWCWVLADRYVTQDDSPVGQNPLGLTGSDCTQQELIIRGLKSRGRQSEAIPRLPHLTTHVLQAL